MKYMAILVLVGLLSCTHSPQIAVTNTQVSQCDSTIIGYKTVIKPIFRDNCYQCHSTAATASGGLDLEDSASLKTYLSNDFRGDGIYGSKLYHCILHSLGAQQMPPNYILDTCEQYKIHHWIASGALMN